MTSFAQSGGTVDPDPPGNLLTVGSLFSGIGGIDLGLERAGMRVIWQSEIDPYASRVLAKHWPDVPNLGDIKTVDWSTVERPDLICGGYPCQPFSHAGRRGGTDDGRHLWPWMRDAIRLLRPGWALLENVPGHLGLGFDAVLADLAALGFDAEWELLPAAAFGAPHLRWRIFVVAHADGEGEPGVAVDAITRSGVMVPDADGEQLRERTGGVHGTPGPREGEAPQRQRVRSDVGDARPVVADTDGERQAGRRLELQSGSQGARNVADSVRGGQSAVSSSSSTFSGRSPDRLGDGGHWRVEPDVGRVADGVPHRVDRLRTLGNAVVPQVAEWVGRRIIEAAA